MKNRTISSYRHAAISKVGLACARQVAGAPADGLVLKRCSRRVRSILAVSVSAVALGGAVSRHAPAATETWTGATNAWATGTNWTGTNTPPLTGDSLIFGVAGAGGTTLSDNLSTTTLSAFTLDGITFNSGASAFTINPLTVNAGFTLAGNIVNNGTTLETISDLIALSGATDTITSNAGGNVTLSGVISGTALTVSGTGTVTLSATNTYTGVNTVNSGTLSISTDLNLGAVPAATTANSITLNGGTLQVTAGSAFNTGTISGNRGITLGAGGGTINVLNAATGTFATNEVAVQYRGIISGSGNLTITGGNGSTGNSGTTPYLFELGAQNTYTGNTTISNAIVCYDNNGGTGPNNILPTTTVLNLINNGWFNFNNNGVAQTIAGLSGDSTGRLSITNGGSAGALTIDPALGQTYTFAGIIGAQTILTKGGTGNAELTVTINGPGTEVLSGANTYTGGTTVNTGTLSVTGSLAANPMIVNAGTLSVTGSLGGGTGGALTLAGGTFSYGGSAAQSVAGLTVNAGISVITNTAAGATPVLTLGGITRNVGGTIDFSTANGTTSHEITSTFSDVNGIIGGWATQGGYATWAVAGGGTATAITGLSAYQPNTSVSLGASTGNTDMTVSGTTSLATGGPINSLRFNTSNADTISITTGQTVILTSGGLLETNLVGNNANLITGGTLEGASGMDLVVIQNNTSNNLTIGSIVANNTSATALSKIGAGTLALSSGLNSYTGNTYIYAGTLQISGIGTLGSGTYTGNILDNTVLEYSSSAAQTLSTGVISGAGALLKDTNSVLTLSGANTYSGGTTINAGTLSISSDGNLGTAPASVTPASITINGGTLQFSSNSAYNTPTINANRGITLGASGGTINVSTVATGSLAVPSQTGVQYLGIVAGTGNLTITGGSGTNSGTAPYFLELGGQSIYAGTTTINNAIVSVDSNGGTGPNNVLPSTTVLNLVNNGWFNFANGNSSDIVAGLSGDSTGIVSITNATSTGLLTIDPVTSHSYTFAGVIGAQTILSKAGANGELSVTINGPGTEILTGANTYTGTTTISQGTLQIGSGGTTGAVAGGA